VGADASRRADAGLGVRSLGPADREMRGPQAAARRRFRRGGQRLRARRSPSPSRSPARR
jgi:hypothetical protein